MKGSSFNRKQDRFKREGGREEMGKRTETRIGSGMAIMRVMRMEEGRSEGRGNMGDFKQGK